MSICAETLERRFSRLPPLGRVYVDPELQHYMVPFSQRSASRSLRTLERGSRIRFGRNADTLRFSIWWRQQPHVRTDLDLSAILYGPDWQYELRTSRRAVEKFDDVARLLRVSPVGELETPRWSLPAEWGSIPALREPTQAFGRSFPA